jgi:hypothetical protein
VTRSQLNAVLIGLGILVLAGAGALVLLRPGGSSCQAIFEQTAPRLEANMELIRTKGGVAISHATVQELAEGAQKVGLHLKTCCTVLEGGKVSPDQFQQCVAHASEYDRKIAATARLVEAASTAALQGATALVEQQKVEIAGTVAAASGQVAALGEQVARLDPGATPQPAPTPPAAPGGVEREPNDSKSSAADLGIRAPTQGEIATPEDLDVFVFTPGVQVRDRVILRLENRSDTLRPYLKVFGPDKGVITEAYNGTPGADTDLEFTAAPGLRYFVEVNPYGTAGRYVLSVLPQSAHDRFEPNDDPIRDRPTPIEIGSSVDASILDTEDDDWYAVKPGSAKLQVALENHSTTLRPNVVVYNARRSQLHDQYDGTPGASLDFGVDVTPGDTYYLQVKPYGTAGGYRLTVR